MFLAVARTKSLTRALFFKAQLCTQYKSPASVYGSAFQRFYPCIWELGILLPVLSYANSSPLKCQSSNEVGNGENSISLQNLQLVFLFFI